MNEVSIRLLWHAQAQFAGCLLAEHAGIAARRGLALSCLDAEPGRAVLADCLRGGAAFAVASPSHVAECADPGALRIVLVLQQSSALVYPARRDHGVVSVADLRGRKAAVWPGGEDLELRWLLHRAGLDDDAVQRVACGDTVGELVKGTVSAAQATSYNEIAHLAALGLRDEDVVLLHAAEHDASLVKDALVCPAALVEESPALVQQVVESVLEGWTTAFRDADAAVAACLSARPVLDATAQHEQLAAIRALVDAGATRTHGLGYPDPAHLTRALQAMRELGEPLPGGTDAIVDTRFWAAAPEELRARWPA